MAICTSFQVPQTKLLILFIQFILCENGKKLVGKKILIYLFENFIDQPTTGDMSDLSFSAFTKSQNPRVSFSFRERNVNEVLLELQRIDVNNSTGEGHLVRSLSRLAAPLIAHSVTNILTRHFRPGLFPVYAKRFMCFLHFKRGFKRRCIICR